jgi:glycosyltransferase involved in cell wall biosynthesis
MGLRVLHVTRQSDSSLRPQRPVGGLERAVCELARAQNSIGLDASIVCGDASDAALEADVIHAHDWYGEPFVRRAFRGGFRAIVATSHLPIRRGFTYRDTSHSWTEKLHMEAQLLDVALAIVAPSPFVAGFLEAEYGIDAGRIHVIPHGVDAVAFTPPRDNHQERSGVHLLVVGRVTAQKGVELLIRAIPHVARHAPGLRVTIVGDGDRVPACKALAQRLGVSNRTTFRPAVPSAELPSLYAGASLLIVPSLFEPFGLCGLEALACGCPVLALRPTGAVYLQPEELADSCSPSRMAHAILARLEATSACERARWRMRALAWPWRKSAAATNELYQRVLG